MAILEGDQGTGKSRGMRALSEPWFSDELSDIGSKDAAMQLQGAWFLEIAELDAFSKPDITRIKAFLSRQADRFRPPYGSRVSEFPRQCIFVGTTNSDRYLKDETGGRRFWPVKCGRIDVDAITRDRDQLWAEARLLFEQGTNWWLDPKTSVLATEQQEERFEADPWHEAVTLFIADKRDVSIEEILEAALCLSKRDWNQAAANRVARVLKRLKYPCGSLVWKREQKRRQWRYVRQTDPQAEVVRMEEAITRLRR
jgi:predicted P-loop ATPase